MPIWISTINAIPDQNSGPFKDFKGVIVNVVTCAQNKGGAIDNILNEIIPYELKILDINDLELFHETRNNYNKKLRKLAAKAQRNSSTEFDVFYTYDE